ncbi:unnamed protein product [Tilletia controversa]|nr:unnamed protein product [Tilletia controversa]
MPRIATAALPRLAGSLISSSSSSVSAPAIRAFSIAAASAATRSNQNSAAATTAAARIPTSLRALSTSAVAMGGHGGEGVGEDNARPPYDQVVQDIADYVHNYEITSEVAYNTARLCLLDSLGCAVEALHFPQAVSVLGPVVPGTTVPNGARVIGTNHVLDPIRAAFNNGALIRWLDFNDTWLAAEWGHPSDNLGSIISVADWLSRTAVANGKKPLTDGSTIGPIALDYPVGHARRREEAIPLIAKKLRKHLEGHFDQARESKIMSLIEDHKALTAMPVPEFVDLWLKA